MVVLAAMAISLLLAYRAMSAGLLAVLTRCLTGMLAIAIGVCLAGPLRSTIPAEGEYLQGGCFIVISLGAYLLMRGLIGYYMLEREVILPGLADRIGAAVCGWFGGLMLCGYICMVIMAFPIPKFAKEVEPQLHRSAELGAAAVRLVALFAGTDQPITLKAILLSPPRSSGSKSEDRAKEPAIKSVGV